jgi:hypothetical protein
MELLSRRRVGCSANNSAGSRIRMPRGPPRPGAILLNAAGLPLSNDLCFDGKVLAALSDLHQSSRPYFLQ